MEQAKQDAHEMLVSARDQSVAPLKAELENIQASVEASREAYTADLARVGLWNLCCIVFSAWEIHQIDALMWQSLQRKGALQW